MDGIPEKYYYQFPWLNGSSDVLFNRAGITVDELNSLSIVAIIQRLLREYPDLKDRILLFFESAVKNEERFQTPTDDIVHLAMYPILQILISMLKNRVLANALSNIYAKHCKRVLAQTGAVRTYPNKLIQQICKNVGIDCNLGFEFIEKIQYSFEMDFASYLMSAARLSDSKWKLVNQRFQDGKIFLIRPDVVMLLREFVRKKVQPDFKDMTPELAEEMEQIPKIKEILVEVEKLIQENMSRFQSSLISDGEKIGSDLFAPCIQAILYRMLQGENLSHNERLAICFFYLNTNHTIEETVDLFRTSPDFDESIARYQVEFAAGSGGKGKKYSMFKCSKLKSLHLCYADHKDFGDKLCIKGAKKRNGEIVQMQNPAKDFIFWKKIELNRLHRTQIAIGEQTITSKTEINEKQSKIPPQTSRK
ncbi:hypothetical protein [Candidatus Lokiarchaeum ossiferum]|uniref:hypothetical protein n=1 Tax=Candidatus Lokiarchaeum ossiferum TaxID=2951803 RepID=UPI00352F2502